MKTDQPVAVSREDRVAADHFMMAHPGFPIALWRPLTSAFAKHRLATPPAAEPVGEGVREALEDVASLPEKLEAFDRARREQHYGDAALASSPARGEVDQ